MKIAVVGVGQSMRGDDAAGLEAVRLWQKRHPEEAGSADIQVRLVTVPGLEAPGALEGAEACVVADAMSGGGEPGRIRLLEMRDLDSTTAVSGSIHGWGFGEELRLGTILGEYPPNLVVRIIGIETAQVQMGSALSQAVQAALPLAADLIHTQIAALRQA